MMKVDWNKVIDRLKAFPPDVHKILAPSPHERIKRVEEQLGRMPEELTQMLQQFNGAELFIAQAGGGEMLTIFGISTEPLLPPLEWAPDWYIDKFTPKWRSAGANRDSDWAIAMTNYGGLILLDEGGTVKEWDTSQGQWGSRSSTLYHWIEEIFDEGNRYIDE